MIQNFTSSGSVVVSLWWIWMFWFFLSTCSKPVLLFVSLWHVYHQTSILLSLVLDASLLPQTCWWLYLWSFLDLWWMCCQLWGLQVNEDKPLWAIAAFVSKRTQSHSWSPCPSVHLMEWKIRRGCGVIRRIFGCRYWTGGGFKQDTNPVLRGWAETRSCFWVWQAKNRGHFASCGSNFIQTFSVYYIFFQLILWRF